MVGHVTEVRKRLSETVGRFMSVPRLRERVMNRTKLIAVIAIVAIVAIALRRSTAIEEYEPVDRID
jgi:hypothetical protein